MTAPCGDSCWLVAVVIIFLMNARAALITRIDSQRDLTAPYVGELQDAYNEQLRQAYAAADAAELAATLRSAGTVTLEGVTKHRAQRVLVFDDEDSGGGGHAT